MSSASTVFSPIFFAIFVTFCVLDGRVVSCSCKSEMQSGFVLHSYSAHGTLSWHSQQSGRQPGFDSRQDQESFLSSTMCRWLLGPPAYSSMDTKG
jgi:hypothetical protein